MIVEAPLHPLDDRIHHPIRLHRRTATAVATATRGAGTRRRRGASASGRRSSGRVVVSLQPTGGDEGGKRVKVREECQRVDQFGRAPLFLFKISHQLSDVGFSHEPRPMGEDLVDTRQIADFLRHAVETLQPMRIPAEVEKVT